MRVVSDESKELIRKTKEKLVELGSELTKVTLSPHNNYRQYIEDNIVSLQTGKTSQLKVDAKPFFGIDGYFGAYHNWLGGGLIGRILGGASFDPDESELTDEQQKHFQNLLEEAKKYLFEQVTDPEDEFAPTYEQNQRMSASAY